MISFLLYSELRMSANITYSYSKWPVVQGRYTSLVISVAHKISPFYVSHSVTTRAQQLINVLQINMNMLCEPVLARAERSTTSHNSISQHGVRERSRARARIRRPPTARISIWMDHRWSCMRPDQPEANGSLCNFRVIYKRFLQFQTCEWIFALGSYWNAL